MNKYIANMNCGTGHTSLPNGISGNNRAELMRAIRECAGGETPYGDHAQVWVRELDAYGNVVREWRSVLSTFRKRWEPWREARG